jgi:hypothetical protein
MLLAFVFSKLDADEHGDILKIDGWQGLDRFEVFNKKFDVVAPCPPEDEACIEAMGE